MVHAQSPQAQGLVTTINWAKARNNSGSMILYRTAHGFFITMTIEDKARFVKVLGSVNKLTATQQFVTQSQKIAEGEITLIAILAQGDEGMCVAIATWDGLQYCRVKSDGTMKDFVKIETGRMVPKAIVFIKLDRMIIWGFFNGRV